MCATETLKLDLLWLQDSIASILLYGSAKSIVNFGKYKFMYCLKIGPSHQYGIPLAGRQ